MTEKQTLATASVGSDGYYKPNDLTLNQITAMAEYLKLYVYADDTKKRVAFDVMSAARQYTALYAARSSPAIQKELDKLHARFIAIRMKNQK